MLIPPVNGLHKIFLIKDTYVFIGAAIVGTAVLNKRQKLF